jgi:hypothetical protein
MNSIKNVGVDLAKRVSLTPVKFTPSRLLAKQEPVDMFISSSSSGIARNPILEAVEKAVPIIREPRVKIAESLKAMILDTTKEYSSASGKDAVVFPIPEHKDLVLRVEKTALDKLKTLPENLELVPIVHEKSVANNPRLGLPLYFVTSESSNIGKKTRISINEALAQPDKIMVLRKATGQHPATECGDKFISLIGFEDFSNPDPNALNNFSYIFGYIAKNFGYEPTKKCLEMFKNGATEISAHELAEGSAPFKIVNGKEFFKHYKEFTSSYIDYLKKVSELPQETYKEAVDFVAMPKSFNVDFQHTNNTFVDFPNKHFNFIDLAYDKSDPKYIYENPVKEFRNVILGKGFRSIEDLRKGVPFLPNLRSPRTFIVCPEDIAEVKKYSKIVNDKINLAAPEEFRSENPFR